MPVFKISTSTLYLRNMTFPGLSTLQTQYKLPAIRPTYFKGEKNATL